MGIDAKALAAKLEEWDTMVEATRFAMEQLTSKGDKLADHIEGLEDVLENLINGAETVLEAWDSGNEASFREAIEEMRADVEAAKGGKDE